MKKIKFIGLFLCFLTISNVYAAEHQVKMLSSNAGEMMVFEPPVLQIKAGDTVRWLNAQPGHNSVSIDEMTPAGGSTWNGKMNEEIVVKFDTEGVYGYKCTPHYILGMVGLIVVGDANNNLSSAKKFAESEESKFATNKSRFSDYFSLIK
ncbi:MAG: Pseudoazurin [Gammaproteobacteria bacterium]|nr:MAG: Pseudoazurin [Gammaproteobacteria bacterium]|tara:strand:+ start:200 stop:649 length:450 start_codon:yes stop_codon:yes gene_type:complete